MTSFLYDEFFCQLSVKRLIKPPTTKNDENLKCFSTIFPIFEPNLVIDFTVLDCGERCILESPLITSSEVI